MLLTCSRSAVLSSCAKPQAVSTCSPKRRFRNVSRCCGTTWQRCTRAITWPSGWAMSRRDYDAHPVLFAAALAALRDLGRPGVLTGPRLAAIELAFLRELGYRPAVEICAARNSLQRGSRGNGMSGLSTGATGETSPVARGLAEDAAHATGSRRLERTWGSAGGAPAAIATLFGELRCDQAMHGS